MSTFASQFQVVSDLHLETPVARPLYDVFNLSIHSSYILLLGDIGLVVDDRLFKFLRRLLEQTYNLRVFYVFGNHEAYQILHSQAVERMRAFEDSTRYKHGNRFAFLHRNRCDINQTISILGCTLWSNISSHQVSDVRNRLTDYNNERGIRDWSVELHNEEHRKDLRWLNRQVQEIQEKEPHRQIIIATHHSPTCDPRATDPSHSDSSISSAFFTDLTKEPCWTSPAVKLWAFGHTHYNCAFQDESTKKLVIADQKGYGELGTSSTSTIQAIIVESDKDFWKFVFVDKAKPKQEAAKPSSKTVCQSSQPPLGKRQKASLFDRGTQKLSTLLRTRTGASK